MEPKWSQRFDQINTITMENQTVCKGRNQMNDRRQIGGRHLMTP